MLGAHRPNRPSAKSNTTLHRVVRNRPARRIASCCSSVARAIACSVTVAREIALRNKIPAARVMGWPVAGIGTQTPCPRRLAERLSPGENSLRLFFFETLEIYYV
jgi:hypothetical protein